MVFRLRLLLDRFKARERLLLLVTVAVFILGITQAILWITGLDNHDAQRDQITTLRDQYQQNQQGLALLQQAQQSPRVQSLTEQNLQLEAQLEALERQLTALTDSLIPPNTMVALLRDLLDRDDLTLVRFSTLPVQALPRPDDQAPELYRHALEMTLSGSYQGVMNYLGSIEALPWRLFWDELSLETEDYPRLNIRLRVHTLSDQEEWLNV